MPACGKSCSTARRGIVRGASEAPRASQVARRSSANSVRLALEYAAVLDCRLIHLMAGVVPGDVPYETAAALYAVNLAWAAEQAGAAGVRLAIEAINGRDIPGYFLRTQEQAAAVAAAIGPDKVGIQFDIYHCQTAQGDISRRLEALLPLIAHIQVADVPGRHEPGTGEIGWEFLFGRIRELGYEGWIGCEYQPKGDTVAGLSWRQRYGVGLEDESCDGNRSKASWRATFRRGSCRLVYGRRGIERSSSDAADRAGAGDGDAGCGHGDFEAPSVVAGDRAAL